MKKLFALALSGFILLGANTFAQKTDSLKKETKTKTTTTTKTATEGVNKSTDKAIGKDAQGRTVYVGPKGGQYTLSESGKKSYLKTADKIKVN
jgi:colicin import membrane protein